MLISDLREFLDHENIRRRNYAHAISAATAIKLRY